MDRHGRRVGLGASLAMETLPTAARGLLLWNSATGLRVRLPGWQRSFTGRCFPFFGWRGLFVAGVLPAPLSFSIRARSGIASLVASAHRAD